MTEWDGRMLYWLATDISVSTVSLNELMFLRIERDCIAVTDCAKD
jgi:hypothetical protein